MFTKGETAGGWVHIHKGKGLPIALVHPKHVDKFIASDDMYEALKFIVSGDVRDCVKAFEDGRQALAKAEGQ